MAEPVVSFVVEELGRWLIEKAKFLHGVSHNIEHAIQELHDLRYFLQDADAKASMKGQATLSNLVAQIREIAYDLEDVIATYAAKVESKRTTQANFVKLMKRYVCIFTEIFQMNKVGSDIEKYSTRISELRSKLPSYGVISNGGGSSSNASSTSQRSLTTYGHVPVEHFVGFEQDIEKLVATLRVEENTSQRVVSIWGMGGSGKTTLAKKVCNDNRVRLHFDCIAWVCISQQTPKEDVWKEILFQLIPSLSNKERAEVNALKDDRLARKLYSVQQERKCLVILDDIWTTEMWDLLKPAFLHGSFPRTNTTSKILITTRNKSIFPNADVKVFQHQLPCLDEHHSLELLETIVFSRMDDTKTSYSKEKKDLGRKMVQYCGGLPLAIVLLGGLLLSKKDWIDEWKVLHMNLEKQKLIMKDNGNLLSQILGLSYNDLPYYLKPCFLHLAHYPKNYEINAKELCMIWVSERIIITSNQLVLQQNSNNLLDMMEETAYDYLTQLVERRMVQVIVKPGSIIGRIKTIRMHDKMRDLCLLKAKQVNFVLPTSFDSKPKQTAVNSNLSSSSGMESKVRRLAIHHSDSYHANVPQIVQKHSKHLRSLMVFDYESGKVSNMLKIGCDLLRVLSYFDSHSLPIEIGHLIQLRFLKLITTSNPVVLLPSTTDAFRSLYVLKLEAFNNEPLKIPNVICKLEQLRHLYLPRYYVVEGEDHRLNLKNLGNFKTLVNIDLQDLCPYYQNGELTNLVKLDVVVHEEIQYGEQIVQSISSNHHLRSLSWKTAKKSHFVKLPAASQYSSNIYKLKLQVEINKSVREIQFPSKLVKLILERTFYTEDPMPTLGKLENLRTLTLHLLALDWDVQEIVCCEDGFPKLEYLHLSELRYINKWEVEEGALCRLSRLIITGCSTLETIPDGLRRIHSLKEIVISSMPQSFTDNVKEGGKDYYKVKHVPSLTLIS